LARFFLFWTEAESKRHRSIRFLLMHVSDDYWNRNLENNMSLQYGSTSDLISATIAVGCGGLVQSSEFRDKPEDTR
jgi:hypothetical protein